MKRHLLGVAAAVLGTFVLGGVGLHTAAAATPVPTTVVLPLFGAPLTLGITTDAGGALTAVSVDPAANTVATKLKPHKVVFQSADPANPTADPARVIVRSDHGGQSVSARSGKLADFTGQPGSWSGDLFGTGVATTATFTIVALPDGSPDITLVSSSDATAVVSAVDHSTGDGHDNGGDMSARVSIKFTNAGGDQSRTLSIRVSVKTGDEESGAKLSISLSPIKGVAGKAVGAHTWTGPLCNGTAATVPYTVAADGTITVGTVVPATGVVSTHDNSTVVTFSDHEAVRISVKKSDNGDLRVDVKVRIDCHSANPTTNVTTSIPTPDTSGDNHSGDNHAGGKGRSDHKGSGGQNQGG